MVETARSRRLQELEPQLYVGTETGLGRLPGPVEGALKALGQQPCDPFCHTLSLYCVCVSRRIQRSLSLARKQLGGKGLVSQPPSGRLHPVSALGFTWGIPL